MLNLLPLSQLLALRQDDYPIAWLAGRPLTLQQLRRDVAALSHWLQAQPGRRWALCYQESYRFTVALLACAHGGCHAVLPGHNRAAQLAELSAHFDGVLTDLPQLVSDLGPTAWLVDGLSSSDLTLRDDRREPHLPTWQGLSLTLFTSGSTGEPKAIHKGLQQLEAEVRVQAELWQASLSSASQSALLASVSHQHIYGLLFRILLPLCAGIPFVAETVEYPEQLSRWRAQHPAQPWLFVSSPAFLARLDPELPVADCHHIFSSGGPLPHGAAQLSQQLYGQWPVEIYGSSETGGIAWRQAETAWRQADTVSRQAQSREGLWRPFPGVETCQDEQGTLLIRSPFLDSEAWWSTSDRVALSDSGFALVGRQDRLIKLAEKRISLDEVERRLRASPWVAEAAAVPLTLANRDLLAAALVLTPEGEHQWHTLGAGHFLLALRQSLRSWLEPVALPRRVRPLAALPRNSQGKLAYAELKALCLQELPLDPDRAQPLSHATSAAAEPLRWPPIREQLQQAEGESQRLTLALWLDPKLLWFQGHFPQAPLLPGVVQIHLAIHYAQQLLGMQGTFAGMEMVKFQQPLRPATMATLQLLWQPVTGKLHFTYLLGDEPASSGRIKL